MQNVTIEAIPNQKFSLTVGNNRYAITLKTNGAVMLATIERNDVTIISGRRCVAGSPLIPFRYLESGNFVFVTQDGDLPWWEQFGVTQSLVYASQDELDTFRAVS